MSNGVSSAVTSIVNGRVFKCDYREGMTVQDLANAAGLTLAKNMTYAVNGQSISGNAADYELEPGDVLSAAATVKGGC